MVKSLRSKKKKRLRMLRREIAKPFYENKEVAKIAAQEAALATPKLSVHGSLADKLAKTSPTGFLAIYRDHHPLSSSLHDFLQDWPSLLPKLISNLRSAAYYSTVNGLLGATNSLFLQSIFLDPKPHH